MQIQQPKIGYKYVNTIYDYFEEVPEDWDVRQFSSFATEITKRFSIDKQGPVLSVTKHRGFVKSLDYFKKQIFSKDIKKYKLVEKEDFAYATIHLDEGSLGLLKEFECGYISPMYTVFRTDDTINPYYLYFLLKTESYIKKYSAIGEGSVHRRKSISFDDLSKLNIPLPHLKEQNRIASILKNLDSLVKLTQNKIEQTQYLQKGLMQKLLTKGIRHSKFKKVKSFFGKYLEIPDEWEQVDLHDVVFYQEGPGLRNWQFTKNGMKIINVKNIIDGELCVSNTDRYISLEEFTKRYSHFAIDEKDIVMSSSGWSYGKVAIVKKSDLPLVMNTSVIRFKSRDLKKLNQNYLYFFLNSYFFKEQIELLLTGIDIPNFGSSHLKKIKMLVPKLEEQKQIAIILSDMEYKISQEKIYETNLGLLKNALMQKLLTGQIRVKI